MTSNEEKVLTWLNDKIGDYYIWGSTGYVLSKSKLDELIAQYPNYVSYSKNSKAIGHRVWDCASLVRYAMKQVGISMVSGATSQWKKTKWARKGTIDQLPKDQVACLYRWTGSVMQHTGIYLGDGYVIDARGSGAGVIKSKLSSYPWTHFGQPQGLIKKEQTNEVISVSYQAKVVADSGSTVRMRSAPSKEASVSATIALGTSVDVVEEAEGWCGIIYNGQKGYMMSQFLEKTKSEEGLYYVRIKCGSQSEAEQLASLLRQATTN